MIITPDLSNQSEFIDLNSNPVGVLGLNYQQAEFRPSEFHSFKFHNSFKFHPFTLKYIILIA